MSGPTAATSSPPPPAPPQAPTARSAQPGSLQSLPDWLAAELQRTGHLVQRPTRPGSAPTPASPRARPDSAPTGSWTRCLPQVEACAAALEGTAFTEKLNRAAYTAGGLIAAGHLTESQARDLLTAAADTARPHRSRHSLAVITSALSAGASRPLHLKGRP